MSGNDLHPWALSPAEARALQRDLAARIVADRPIGPYATIGAADISFNRGDDRLFAAVVVVEAGTHTLIERVGLVERAAYPYIPGLLSFREAPAVLKAFEQLKAPPDVLICDGQGIAHPRRLGIASHVGLWLGLPTVGCAKKRLCGTYDEPGPDRGDRSTLFDGDEAIGTVLRTRPRTKPVFVSPGHLSDPEGSVRLVLETTGKYRLPTPIRLAHAFVNDLRRAADEGRPPPR